MHLWTLDREEVKAFLDIRNLKELFSISKRKQLFFGSAQNSGPADVGLGERAMCGVCLCSAVVSMKREALESDCLQ